MPHEVADPTISLGRLCPVSAPISTCFVNRPGALGFFHAALRMGIDQAGAPAVSD